MPNYEHLTRDELLYLAQQRDQLTHEARESFDVELASRKVTAEEIQSYARETAADERIKQRRKERSRYAYETRSSRFFGKKNRYQDPGQRIEEFDTTRWFVIWIPLVPLASYRIRRLYRHWWTLCPSTKLHILETRPRDWQQIFLTWGKTAVIALAIFLALALGIRRH